MGGEFLFNNRYSNVFFWINYMRRWDIKDLINFQSTRRRSHSKETFFNSNWLWRRLCFFFILNNLLCCRRGDIESIIELCMLYFIHMRKWDIRDLTHFRSIGRRSHCKETFCNSNWLCRRCCFFFILNNFITKSREHEFWVKKSCGAGCDLQSAIMILTVLAKGSVEFCLEILWVFSRTNKVVQARRKGQTHCSKRYITVI